MFNVGTGRAHTLNEVYATIAEHLGFSAPPKYGPERVGDIKHSLANIERAQKDLGYEPKVHFHEGLKKTVQWYVSENEKKMAAARA